MKIALKKIFALLLAVVMTAAMVSCSSGTDEQFQQETPSLTSEWKFYSVTTDGKTTYANAVYNLLGAGEPTFSSPDGENFTLSITGDKEYHGTITENEDGSWELHKGDNPNTVNASISGNELTLTFTAGKILVFRTE